MAIRYFCDGYGEPDDEGNPPYPDMAEMKVDAQTVKDLVLAIIADSNPLEGNFHKGDLKTMQRIRDHALKVAASAQTIVDYGKRYGL